MNYFRIIDRCLWALLIIIASVYIVLAVCMSLGRFYMPQLEKLSPQFIALLEDRTGLEWQIEGFSGEWKKFRPVFRVDSLVASLPNSSNTQSSIDTDQTVFSLVDGELRLDLIASAMDLGLRITHVSAQQLSLSLDKNKNNQWTMRGIKLDSESQDLSLQGFVQRLQSIDAQKISIDLPSGELLQDGAKQDQRVQLPMMKMHFQQFAQTRQFVFTQQDGDKGSFTLYANAIGDPFAAEAQVDVYAVAKKLSLSPWFVSADTNKQWLVNNWSGEFWAAKKPFENWQANVEIKEGLVQRNDDPDWRLSDITLRLSAEFGYAGDGQNNIDVWWQKLGASWRDEPLNMPLARVVIERDKPAASKILLSMPTVDIGQLTEIVNGSKMLSGELSEALQSLNIDGSVQQLHLAMPIFNDSKVDQKNNKQMESFKLEALLDDVSFNAWKNIPGITGLSGYLQTSSEAGNIELLSHNNFSLHLPNVYHDALLFDQIEARLHWSILDKRLFINAEDMHFAMTGDEGVFGARFHLNSKTYIEDEPSQIALHIGVSNSHSSQLLKLLPYKMNPNAKNWIAQSDFDGDIIDGAFVYHGSLAKEEKDKRSVKMYLNLADTAFNFHPQWAPVSNIDGLFMLADSDAQMTVYAGEFEQMAMSNTQVMLRGAGPDAAVDIDSQLAGGLGDVLNILQTSPLKARLENTIGDWNAKGKLHDAKLRLHVPLNKSESNQSKVDFTAAIKNSDIEMSNVGLTVNNLAGPIAYSTSKGLVSKQLSGSLWGKPISFVLGDYSDDPQLQSGNSVRVDGQLDVETKHLYQWLKQPVLAMATGSTAMKLRLDHSAAHTVLTADSDLVGVELQLPAPLYKSKAEKASLALNWRMSAAGQPMTINIAEYADMQLNFERYKMAGGRVYLGQRTGAQAINNNLDSKLRISGYLPSFNLTEWLSVFNRFEKATADLTLNTVAANKNSLTEYKSSNIVVKDLILDDVLAFGERFTQAVVSVAERDKRWQFDIESDQLKGRIALPKNDRVLAPDVKSDELSSFNDMPLILSGVEEAQRYIIDLNYLRINQSKPIEKDALLTKRATANSFLLPANLVAAKINIQKLYWSGKDIGRWQFLLSPSNNAVLVHDIKVDYASMLFESEQDNGLLWARSDTGDYASSLSLTGTSDSVEKFISRFGNRPNTKSPIKSKQAEVTIDLDWEGGPDEFSLYQSEGIIDFKFKNGQFLKTSDSAEGLLKLIGVINFDTLVRRMKLNFSDLYKEGLSFDSVTGTLSVSDGMARFYDTPIMVKAPSSLFALSGEVDLMASTIDAELIATLPVASNLPWLAVLTGGLPVAAGVYIASKVFEDELDKLSSAVYIIEGPLADPEARFERLFDNKTEKTDSSE